MGDLRHSGQRAQTFCISSKIAPFSIRHPYESGLDVDPHEVTQMHEQLGKGER